MTTVKPGVGIGLLIINGGGQVLVGKRTGSHAQKYSIFGGGLEAGESFIEAAQREAKEELDIELLDTSVIAVTNNLETYREDGVHYISVIVIAKAFNGEPKIMEPTKCTEILWCNPKDLPQPHFDASRMAIDCYLSGQFWAES